ncbi:hypothetical protein L1887_19820 [Cichorium endivia]|nr:hypothetical protein L1887_19820 [Cichorium endivia]
MNLYVLVVILLSCIYLPTVEFQLCVIISFIFGLLIRTRVKAARGLRPQTKATKVLISQFYLQEIASS